MKSARRLISDSVRAACLSFDILRRARPSPDAAATVRLQTRRLRRTVAYAWTHVPFYKQLFDAAGIRPSDIRSLDDLTKIPVTTRADLQRAPAGDLISDDYRGRGLLVFKTSGASGLPLSVYQSRWESFVLHVLKLRTLRALGLRWRDRMLKIHNRYYAHRPPSWKAFQRLGLLRQEVIDPQSPDKVAALLRGKQAEVLMGYTGFLVRAAQILGADTNTSLRPRFLVGGSETMTPFLRSQIQAGFRAPVRDTYICQETGIVAWECPASGLYHVLDDSLVVEILRQGLPCRPGEVGEVVVTGLIQRAMPFIRYSLGDAVVLSDALCPCGRRSLSFERTLGKMQDFFWLPDGREFNPWELAGLWTGRAAWIRQYELVQEAPDSVVMRIVPSGPPPAEDVAALTEESRRILGPGVSFRAEFVQDIKPDAGGKFRIHRSAVRSLYNNAVDKEWLSLP